MFSNDHDAASEPAMHSRQARKTRTRLMRWSVDQDQFLLLSIQEQCTTSGINMPWTAIGALMTPQVSRDAILQHLTKVRDAREATGLPVPARSSRARATTGSAPRAPHPSLLPSRVASRTTGPARDTGGAKSLHKEFDHSRFNGSRAAAPDAGLFAGPWVGPVPGPLEGPIAGAIGDLRSYPPLPFLAPRPTSRPPMLSPPSLPTEGAASRLPPPPFPWSSLVSTMPSGSDSYNSRGRTLLHDPVFDHDLTNARGTKRANTEMAADDVDNPAKRSARPPAKSKTRAYTKKATKLGEQEQAEYAAKVEREIAVSTVRTLAILKSYEAVTAANIPRRIDDMGNEYMPAPYSADKYNLPADKYNPPADKYSFPTESPADRSRMAALYGADPLYSPASYTADRSYSRGPYPVDLYPSAASSADRSYSPAPYCADKYSFPAPGPHAGLGGDVSGSRYGAPNAYMDVPPLPQHKVPSPMEGIKAGESVGESSSDANASVGRRGFAHATSVGNSSLLSGQPEHRSDVVDAQPTSTLPASGGIMPPIFSSQTSLDSNQERPSHLAGSMNDHANSSNAGSADQKMSGTSSAAASPKANMSPAAVSNLDGAAVDDSEPAADQAALTDDDSSMPDFLNCDGVDWETLSMS